MDKISSQQRSQNMRAIQSKDMQPEMVVRRLVHSMGYRYRLHSVKLPGKPDIVFPSRKKAIFVHGCFWHQHEDPSCRITRMPKSNTEYWERKLIRNKQRDQEKLKTLQELGWNILILWECQIKAQIDLENRIRIFLDNKQDI